MNKRSFTAVEQRLILEAIRLMAEVLCETLVTGKEELGAGKSLMAEVQGESLLAGDERLMAGEVQSERAMADESLMDGKGRAMAGEDEWREEEPASSTRRWETS